MPFFRIRSVLEELEAHLLPASGGTGTGKAERKRYGDGSERLKVTARALPVPDGTSVQIQVDGTVHAEVAVDGGRVKVVIESPRAVPRVAQGHKVEIVMGVTPLLNGVFMPE